MRKAQRTNNHALYTWGWRRVMGMALMDKQPKFGCTSELELESRRAPLDYRYFGHVMRKEMEWSLV